MDTTLSLLQSYRGLRTSVHPSALGLGYLSEAKNVRYDDGVIALRGGIELVDAQGIAQTYKGGAFFDRDGNNYYVFAMSHGSSDVRIYYSVYSGTWSAASEVTASSGKYGNTRMSEPESGFVTFTGVPGPFGTSFVIVQNGVDDPRVVALGGSPYTAKNVAITAPNELSNNTPTFTAADFLDIMNAGATVATTVSGSGLSPGVGGSPQYWEFTSSGSGVSDGDIAQLYQNGLTVDCSDSNQVWIVGETGDEGFLYGFKWSIRDSSGNLYVVHDPENGRDNITRVPTNIPSLWVYVIPIGEHTRTASLNAINGIRIEAQNAGLGVSQSLKIRAFLASGKVPGGSQYAISWLNSSTRAESPSVVLRNPNEGDGIGGIFGSSIPNIETGFKLPISGAMDYYVKVPTLAPTTADRDLGVDYCDVYRKDPADSDFYYVGTKQTSTYSGGWAYQSPFTSTALRQLFADTVPTWSKDDSKIAPGAYVESIPIGQAGAFSGDRMYFEAKSDSNGRAAIYVSDYQQPFRFRSIPISSESYNAGYSAVLDGEKDIVAIVPHSSSTVGSGSVYVFTNKACYSVNEYLVTRIFNLGCAGVDAFSVDDNNVFFLDNELQVRALASGLVNLSRYKVDDQFNSVTGSAVSFQRFRGRLYALTTANTVMVWNDQMADWESLDTTALNIAQFHKWEHNGLSKLYVSLTNGDLYEYDSGTLDGASQIAFSLTGPEFHDSDWNQIRMGKAYIVCDDKDSESATTTYVARNPSATGTGSISLDAGSGETSAWRKESSSGKDVMVRGCSVKPKIAATIEGPWNLYAWTVKTDWKAGRGATT